MNLTNAQVEAIASGVAVCVDVHGTPCILIRKDRYEEKQRSWDEADLPSSQAISGIIGAVMAEDDADDPTLDYYQQYKRAP